MKYDFIEQNSTTMTMCPHGSVYWALAMLKQERRVRPLSAEYYYMYDDNMEYPIRKIEIATGASAEGYKKPRFLHAYQGIKFEIYEEPKFKVGDWVRDKHYNTYHQICEVRKETIVHRQAGLPKHYDSYREEHYTDVFEVETEPASIEPDFSNVEIGDECFSLFYGKCKINALSNTDEPGYRICQEYRIGIAPCNGILDTSKHRVDGKLFKEASYPQLFNDHHQAKAYFDELFMKLDEEQR